jgi:hypothetical protein
MTTGSNFSRFRGNNEGKTKLAICEEIAAVLKEKKIIIERPAKQILDKIHSIEKSFKAAHDWINHTGQGVDDREQFREAVLKRCLYYYELEATMGDRAANQALVTNDDLEDDSLDDDKEEEMEEVNNRNRNSEDNDDNDDNDDNEEEEAIDDDEESIDEEGHEEDESQLRTPTNNSTISSRHSLLRNLSAAAGNKRPATVSASVPGTVVTSDKDKAKKAKNQKRNVKSPAINKMSADDNLISRILAIKQSTTQQGQQQQDNKWSTKTAEVEYKKCMEYKTEEMEYKMKCMENIANLKRAGWSNPRIGKVFPEFILLLNGYEEDQDMDDCSSIQHSE